MPKEYKCLQCEKVFKKKYYRLKHVRYQHQFYQCEICKQMIKEGSRNVHMLRCKKKEELKTTRCLLCGKDFIFEEILYHLKKVHCAWNHITHIKKTEQHHQDSSNSDTESEMETIHCQIVNGHIAPPPSPAVNQQQQKEEVPEEIFHLVEELKAIGATEQKLQEERQQQQAAPEMPEDLNQINKEDLVKFEDFDFNLLLL